MRRSRFHNPAFWMLVAMLLLAILCLSTLNYYCGWYPLTERARRMQAAREAYQSSRLLKGLEPDTAAFLSFGIRAGMSEAEVDYLLPTPVKKDRHMIEVDPPWAGFVNAYEFWHGPMDTVRGPGKERPFSKEFLSVYFDEEGRAVKLTLFQWGELHTFSRDWHTFDLRELGNGG